MDNFKDYIRSAGCSPAPDVAALDAMVADYAWFTVARVVGGVDVQSQNVFILP